MEQAFWRVVGLVWPFILVSNALAYKELAPSDQEALVHIDEIAEELPDDVVSSVIPAGLKANGRKLIIDGDLVSTDSHSIETHGAETTASIVVRERDGRWNSFQRTTIRQDFLRDISIRNWRVGLSAAGQRSQARVWRRGFQSGSFGYLVAEIQYLPGKWGGTFSSWQGGNQVVLSEGINAEVKHLQHRLGITYQWVPLPHSSGSLSHVHLALKVGPSYNDLNLSISDDVVRVRDRYSGWGSFISLEASLPTSENFWFALGLSVSHQTIVLREVRIRTQSPLIGLSIGGHYGF